MKNLLRSTLLSVLFVSLASTVSAQEARPESANASRYGVAVVDINYIFKNYAHFKTSMDGIKADIQQAEVKLKTDREAIQAMEAKAKDFKPSSPEYKQLDENLARRKAEFNISAGRIRKEFQEREAKVYYETYQRVSGVVQQYAQKNNIGLVFKFNGDPINPERPETILKAINKPVVAHNNIDISRVILDSLNRGGASTAARTGAVRAQ